VDVTSPLGIAFNPASNRLYWANNSGSTETTRVKYAELSGSTSITGQVFSMGVSTGGGLRSMALDPAAGRLYWGNSSGSGKIEYAALDSSGADSGAMSLDDANHNNLDGVTLLKDPEPVSAPSVSGTSQVGSELSCSDATWASDLLSGSLYRMPKTTGFGGWTKDGNPIAGANSATFTPTETGSYRCMRTATNFAGTSTQTSAPVAVTQPEPPTDPPTETPTDPPTETPAEPPANPPAGDFTFGKPKLDTKHGTAKLPVDLPGAGEVELAKTKNVKAHDKRAGAAGTVKLLIKPRGDAADKLAKRGSVKVTAKVTFTPDGGTANTESTKVKLKLGD
jgi:hypothetical protein